ncbi:hypothetical protein GPECTOR_16g571 [Gonium pectorale]|uniref:Uncharacterized protein n=1 Tax=Gonium pectorale TaxID=33097 RepID=A0A150GKU0_GONPE|nr:hypothetical protein GPECTOR_16g571 [Gonium pectorale]|eukprot:KXZ50398.1 hypothetical protein GPECTOR_16g571 [Gonium pectorale]
MGGVTVGEMGRYWSQKQSASDAAAAAAAEAATSAAFDARVQAMIKEQQAVSRSVQQQLAVMRQRRLAANLEYQALRLPHFTPPRPLALLTAPDGGATFRERLFTRALATSLMAAVGMAAEAEGGDDLPAAAGLLGGAAVESVWCEMGQSRISLQDPPLARLGRGVKDVLDDYDSDDDGRLVWREAEGLLGDLWRLVMAQQDLAAWTPAEAAAELNDAADLEWPLETPRATPDAERAAAGHRSTLATAGTVAPRSGGFGGAGSETSSINIPAARSRSRS